MATFSIDVTSVLFAGQKVGYKDITITDMPASGVTCSITSGSSYFAYRLPGSSQSVYRVYTLDVYISNNTGNRTGVFRIENNSDSSDYLEVTLTQRCVDTNNIIAGVIPYSYAPQSKIYEKQYHINQRALQNYGYYAVYVASTLDSTSAVEVWADGDSGVGYITVSDSNWIYKDYYNTGTLSYTDTGFTRYKFYLTTNWVDPARTGYAYFVSETDGNKIRFYQNGHPGSRGYVSDEILYFPFAGDTQSCTVYQSWGDTNISTLSDIPMIYGSGFSYSITNTGYNTAHTENTYGITLGQSPFVDNTYSIVPFTGSASGHLGEYIGHTVLKQGDVPVLAASPSSLTYPSSGGVHTINVTYNGTLTVGTLPSWLTETHTTVGNVNYYTLTASQNSSASSRSFTWVFTDSETSITVPITQTAASGDFSISPSSLSFDSTGGTDTVYLSNAPTSLSYNIRYDQTGLGWLTVNLAVSSVTIRAGENDTFGVRSASIDIYNTNDSAQKVTVRITQEDFTLTVTPSSLSFTDAGGDLTLTPDPEYPIIAQSLPSWITTPSYLTDPLRLIVRTPANSGFVRDAVVRFYINQHTDHYVDVPIHQDGIIRVSANPTSLLFPETGGSLSTTISNLPQNYDFVSYWDTGLGLLLYDGSLRVTVDDNTGGLEKSGYVRVVDQDYPDNYCEITLHQQGSGFIIYPYTETIAKDSCSTFVNIIAGSDRTISCSTSESWISYVGRTGDTLKFNCSANNTGIARTGTVTITAQGLTPAQYTIIQTLDDAPQMVVTPENLYFNAGRQDPLQISVTYAGEVRYAEFGTHIISVDYAYRVGNTFVYNVSYEGPSSGMIVGDMTYIKFYGSYGNCETVDCYWGYISAEPQKLEFYKDGGKLSFKIFKAPSYSVAKWTGVGWEWDWYNDDWELPSPAGTWCEFVIPAEIPSGPSPGIVGGYNYEGMTINVSENNTGEDRSGFLYFQYRNNENLDRLHQLAVPIIQYAIERPHKTLSCRPSSLRYYKEGGSKRLIFNKIPEFGLGYRMREEDYAWVSIDDTYSDSYFMVTVTENQTGLPRRTTIEFYDLNDEYNSVIVKLVQGGDGYDSIWRDNLYYPQNRDENDNFYYRLQDKNGDTIFTGISTVPAGWTGSVGGIDIPRLVELESYFDVESEGIWTQMDSYDTISLYDMTDVGYPGNLIDSFKYWNDWSEEEIRYDYTRYINDPINGKGCEGMVIPVCIYYDDQVTFKENVTNLYDVISENAIATPSWPFSMIYKRFYHKKKVEYLLDGDVVFGYDLTYCGPGALIYRNRFGGWDSFLIEGNISKTDKYQKQTYKRDGEYGTNVDQGYGFGDKYTEKVDITETYEAHTGWLTDEESERLAYHLLSSPIVYYQDFTDEDLENFSPVNITLSSTEHKKFRNGRRLVSYTITFEKSNTKKVGR